MTIEDLSEIEPGDRVGNLHFTHGNTVDDGHTVNEGIVPATSGLAGEDAAAYVVVDSGGDGVVAFGLDHMKDRTAELGILPMAEGAGEDAALIHAAAEAIMHKRSIRIGRLAPEVGGLAQQTQTAVGFLPGPSGIPELLV